MDERTETTLSLNDLFTRQHFAVLATHQEGRPYASLVAFAATPDLRRLVFTTMRATRKFTNLSADARVALLIDNRSNQETDLSQAVAVTATGRACEALGSDRAALEELFLAKHPSLADFVASPGCAVLAVDVDLYYVVSRFQNVYELRP
jgi:nitroimidazol reductase NimA-like FMN-containing flavoprotein (pyridoxamine 5'-phosphate oxidase superfamily)